MVHLWSNDSFLLEGFLQMGAPNHRFQWSLFHHKPSILGSSVWRSPQRRGSHGPCGCSACQRTTPLVLVAKDLRTPLAGPKFGNSKVLCISFKQLNFRGNESMEILFASFISQTPILELPPASPVFLQPWACGTGYILHSSTKPVPSHLFFWAWSGHRQNGSW